MNLNLIMWAHHHSYQRTCPVYQQNCMDGGTTHVVIGMGGRDLSTDLIPWASFTWSVARVCCSSSSV